MPATLETHSLDERILASEGRRSVADVPRILLADDQQEMLREINLILRDDFCIVGTVRNGGDAIELTTGLHPDVLVLDLSMPVFNGIEVASHLKMIGSPARVIFLTVHGDQEFVEAALSKGAVGYVVKSSIATDLVPAVWAAIQGKIFISPALRLQ